MKNALLTLAFSLLALAAAATNWTNFPSTNVVGQTDTFLIGVLGANTNKQITGANLLAQTRSNAIPQIASQVVQSNFVWGFVGQTNLGANATNIQINIGKQLYNTNYFPTASLLLVNATNQFTVSYHTFTTNSFNVHVVPGIDAGCPMRWAVFQSQ